MDKNGYGEIRIDHETYFAHRAMFQDHTGIELTPDVKLLHRCDNPQCINPAHLFRGSQIDNIRDMDEKGRRQKYKTMAKGSRHGLAKINEATALLIFQSTLTMDETAHRYNVSRSMVERIKYGVHWTHVTGLKRRKRKQYR